MLYYELYVAGGVSTLILADLHMTFTFFVIMTAFGNLVGAFGSLFAGLTDRFGRTNIVIYGLLITAVFVAFIIPNAGNKWNFLWMTFVVGAVEGMCLVATPALVRDFSPQVGRAQAMGFWTAGPVVGSLVVAVVGSNTITEETKWQHEYFICGIVGLVVWVIVFIFLRELSPGLRDQLMVTERDRTLVEARAKGLDIAESLKRPWRQLLKVDVVVSAIAVSVMLLIYYTAVGFGVIYLTTIFGFSLKDANGLGNWNWGFDIIGLIIFGYLSDRMRVRKPFMVVGAALCAVTTVLFLIRAGHAETTSYYHLALLLAALGFTLSWCYVPWMASFTETVEARNPALTATGLAIWGWIIRVVVFIAFMIIPVVINSVTPLVDYGAGVSAASAKYSSELAFASAHPQVVANATKLAPELQAISAHPQIFAELQANPTDPALIAQAEAAVGPATFSKIVQNQSTIASLAPYSSELKQLASVSNNPDFLFLQKHGPTVEKAAAKSPGQWQTWYWICFACLIFFIICVPILKGRWSPKKAKADEDAHKRWLDAELEKLHIPEHT